MKHTKNVFGAIKFAGALTLAAVGLNFACDKQQAAPAAPSTEVASAEDPAFDSKWKSLASDGVEAVYIEDDKGEGLMGNVRRASDMRPDPAKGEALAASDSTLPDAPAGTAIQQVIRGNLAAVKSCYMTMSRSGTRRSGKAIVSFSINPDGQTTDVKVDAPSFTGTNLPKCMGGQVARWSFPKSQKGGGGVSYPFVFVGG
jgi:hypothetical protein